MAKGSGTPLSENPGHLPAVIDGESLTKAATWKRIEVEDASAPPQDCMLTLGNIETGSMRPVCENPVPNLYR